MGAGDVLAEGDEGAWSPPGPNYFWCDGEKTNAKQNCVECG